MFEVVGFVDTVPGFDIGFVDTAPVDVAFVEVVPVDVAISVLFSDTEEVAERPNKNAPYSATATKSILKRIFIFVFICV
jgi:hypothetical protein